MSPYDQCSGTAFLVILLLMAASYGLHLIISEHRLARRAEDTHRHYFTKVDGAWTCDGCPTRIEVSR